MQGIAVWERRRHPKQRRRKCRSSWIFILFGKRQHAASRVADKGTGFSMQFEYRRPESSMLITEQNRAVSFARCLLFVLIPTSRPVTHLSLACQSSRRPVDAPCWKSVYEPKNLS